MMYTNEKLLTVYDKYPKAFMEFHHWYNSLAVQGAKKSYAWFTGIFRYFPLKTFFDFFRSKKLEVETEFNRGSVHYEILYNGYIEKYVITPYEIKFDAIISIVVEMFSTYERILSQKEIEYDKSNTYDRIM